MEEKSSEEREFQNLLAIRGQLAAFLIATSGGVVWLMQQALTKPNALFITIGLFFISRIVVSIHTTNEKLDKITKGR